jgi:hypothetical protein
MTRTCRQKWNLNCKHHNKDRPKNGLTTAMLKKCYNFDEYWRFSPGSVLENFSSFLSALRRNYFTYCVTLYHKAIFSSQSFAVYLTCNENMWKLAILSFGCWSQGGAWASDSKRSFIDFSDDSPSAAVFWCSIRQHGHIILHTERFMLCFNSPFDTSSVWLIWNKCDLDTNRAAGIYLWLLTCAVQLSGTRVLK